MAYSYFENTIASWFFYANGKYRGGKVDFERAWGDKKPSPIHLNDLGKSVQCGSLVAEEEDLTAIPSDFLE